MKQNIDLTENRDFAKKINERIFTARQILFEEIRDEEDYLAYEMNHCDRCGVQVKVYPWTPRKLTGLCESCDETLDNDFRMETISYNPFVKSKFKSVGLIKENYRKPWWFKTNTTIEKLRMSFQRFVTMDEIMRML